MSANQNRDDADHILRPRAVRPDNPMVLRAQSDERSLKPNIASETPSGVSRYHHLDVLLGNSF